MSILIMAYGSVLRKPMLLTGRRVLMAVPI